MADSFLNHRYKWGVIFCLVVSFAAAFSSDLQEFDPDSIPVCERAKEDYNPFTAFYSMNSWTVPVLDHKGNPHVDGHAIQIIADGGNGIQDPPNSNGSPGGDDSLADGNFSMQFVNGKKHDTEGVVRGMFVGMWYFVPYKDRQVIYLRIWEGSDPAEAEYYQDSEEYTTYQGNIGGRMIELLPGFADDVDWRFGPSQRLEGKK